MNETTPIECKSKQEAELLMNILKAHFVTKETTITHLAREKNVIFLKQDDDYVRKESDYIKKETAKERTERLKGKSMQEIIQESHI